MSVVKIKYGYRGGEVILQTPTVIPTTVAATPTVATSAAEVLRVDETKYPLWQELPYSGEGFVVEKYTAPKTLLVQQDGISTSSATRAIKTWLATFGEAGKGHKIEF